MDFFVLPPCFRDGSFERVTVIIIPNSGATISASSYNRAPRLGYIRLSRASTELTGYYDE